MKVLVIGSGGREDAICRKISQSPLCEKLFCAPGNPGTARYAENIGIKVDDLTALLNFAAENKIDLSIVGPELPLTLGITDLFEQAGLCIFGPDKSGAQLEGSKSFTKDVLVKAGVPTAAYENVSSLEQAKSVLSSWTLPYVIKADGLAAGKGVIVCHKQEHADAGLEFVFKDLKADKVVLEQFLEGVEASFIIATDGENIVPLAASHDYKRIFDQDQGPNTGGMGTVCPTPRLSEEQGKWTVINIIRPTLAELKRRGILYKGFLYAGLMISAEGQINVIEYNARLGDPETQVILSRLQSDLLPVLARLAGHKDFAEHSLSLDWKAESAVSVVLASAGYPQSSSSGDEITGIEQAQTENLIVYHAGTRLSDDKKLTTAGGRVLNVTGLGKGLEQARSNAYMGLEKIHFMGMQYRKDIGIR